MNVEETPGSLLSRSRCNLQLWAKLLLSSRNFEEASSRESRLVFLSPLFYAPGKFFSSCKKQIPANAKIIIFIPLDNPLISQLEARKRDFFFFSKDHARNKELEFPSCLSLPDSETITSFLGAQEEAPGLGKNVSLRRTHSLHCGSHLESNIPLSLPYYMGELITKTQ